MAAIAPTVRPKLIQLYCDKGEKVKNLHASKFKMKNEKTQKKHGYGFKQKPENGHDQLR